MLELIWTATPLLCCARYIYIYIYITSIVKLRSTERSVQHKLPSDANRVLINTKRYVCCYVFENLQKFQLTRYLYSRSTYCSEKSSKTKSSHHQLYSSRSAWVFFCPSGSVCLPACLPASQPTIVRLYATSTVLVIENR